MSGRKATYYCAEENLFYNLDGLVFPYIHIHIYVFAFKISIKDSFIVGGFQ